RALLAGRVLEAKGCGAADVAAAEPVPGARLYLEDGRYVVADVRGRWHFDDLRPGTHVLQLDQQGLPAGVEVLHCADHTRSAGTAFSRFIDLQGGTLWQEDFYVKRADPQHLRMEELQRQVAVRLASETVADGLRYALAITHAGTRVEAARLQVWMPADLVVVPGSLRLDDVVLPDPVADAKGWRVELPALADAADSRLEWTVALAPGARPGQHSVLVQLGATVQGQPLEFDLLENRASVTVPERLGRVIIFRPRFASFSTALAPADKRWLDDISTELGGAGEIRMEIVGHTDNVRVVPRKGRAINDNHQLSQVRAQSVADYLKQKLGLADDRIQAIGKGEDEPIDDNTTPKGRDANRRVELKVYARGEAAATRLELVRADSGELRREWTEWQAVAVAAAPDAADAVTAEAPEDKGIGLLSHRDGEVVADRVQALRVRVDSRLKTDILLDGQPIPEDRLGFRKDEGKTTLMSFVGVDLGEPGPHLLHIRGTDPFGIVRVDQRMTVVVASDITRIRPAQSP
ncbi:MAG: OmpA family protein, partial [Rhodoferax sp.]